MKRILSISLTALALAPCCVGTITAEAEDSARVFVTIADENGKLALAQAEVAVTDIDGDGALTLCDALYAAHEANYPGGAAAGFASSEGPFGKQLDQLWGAENGTGYGYYVNHTSAMSLGDPISDGDYVAAFVYTDTTAWSDSYCWFDCNTAEISETESITLTLSAAGYDENWNPISLPVSGAVITINGEKTEYITDENGSAAISFESADSYLISAVSDTQILVPPVCKIAVSAQETTTTLTTPADTETTTSTAQTAPTTSDRGIGAYFSAAAVLSGIALISRKRKHETN